MKIKRNKISSPVGVFVNVVGVIVFIASIFTSLYYFAIDNYIFTIWAFLSGLLFFAICSGISELLYQLLKLRRRIISINAKKEEKKW